MIPLDEVLFRATELMLFASACVLFARAVRGRARTSSAALCFGLCVVILASDDTAALIVGLYVDMFFMIGFALIVMGILMRLSRSDSFSPVLSKDQYYE